MTWIRDYLNNRRQFTVLNGVSSDLHDIKSGIPQGSILGPTLFTLYTSDLLAAVTNGEVHMYADDTTIYCIGSLVDSVILQLNAVLKQLMHWCNNDTLVPHPKKCEAMILNKKCFVGPLNALTLVQHRIKWVSSSRLLGEEIDDKLSWCKHISEVKKGFLNKLSVLKRSRFLPKSMQLDLYFKII